MWVGPGHLGTLMVFFYSPHLLTTLNSVDLFLVLAPSRFASPLPSSRKGRTNRFPMIFYPLFFPPFFFFGCVFRSLPGLRVAERGFPLDCFFPFFPPPRAVRGASHSFPNAVGTPFPLSRRFFCTPSFFFFPPFCSLFAWGVSRGVFSGSPPFVSFLPHKRPLRVINGCALGHPIARLPFKAVFFP